MDCSIRTRALPVGASSRMPPASIFGCEHSTESNVVLPVPAGPISTESRDSASSFSAAVFSARALSSSSSALPGRLRGEVCVEQLAPVGLDDQSLALDALLDRRRG